MRELGVQSPGEYALHPNRIRERLAVGEICFRQERDADFIDFFDQMCYN